MPVTISADSLLHWNQSCDAYFQGLDWVELHCNSFSTLHPNYFCSSKSSFIQSSWQLYDRKCIFKKMMRKNTNDTGRVKLQCKCCAYSLLIIYDKCAAYQCLHMMRLVAVNNNLHLFLLKQQKKKLAGSTNSVIQLRISERPGTRTISWA